MTYEVNVVMSHAASKRNRWNNILKGKIFMKQQKLDCLAVYNIAYYTARTDLLTV